MTRAWKSSIGAIGVAVLAAGLGAVPASTAGAAPAPVAPAAAPQAGPALLNQPAPAAPQFQNTGIWRAQPTQVCHTSAYRGGEYVHQGCIYDDQGGGVAYPYPLRTLARNYSYPTNPVYRGNIADILEVRTKPLADATAFRVTFNSMTDPKLVGTTLALGSSATALPVPHGANTVMPAREFVTVHGGTGDIVDAATGKPNAAKPTVSVDVAHRQLTILVPHSAFDPTGQRSVRLAAAAGLWDTKTNRYMIPQTIADATHPGGAIPLRQSSAFFDAAFRFNEPVKAPWRDYLQKAAIGKGDLSPFFADVDFTKLAAGVTDNSGVPTSGYLTRIFASRFESAQGRRQPSDPGGPPTGAGTQQGGIHFTKDGKITRPSLQFGWVCRDHCVPDIPGNLQRYTIFVPKTAAPKSGYGSMFFLPGYALTADDEVAGQDDIFHEVANRPGNPGVVVDMDARGSDEWFYGQSGANVFEAIADVRRHYHLDNAKTMLGGFSSGAYGANKLSLQFPDVFSRAFVCDGLDEAPSFPGVNGIADKLPVDTLTVHTPGSKLTPMLANRRNQPVMEWAGINDDFIPYDITRERADAYARSQQDYSFISWAGLAAEHLTMCHNGMWKVLNSWLGDEKGRTPFHVTFVRNPLMDDPGSGLVGDKAYWLSGITSRTGKPGTVDAVSHGFGLADPPATNKQSTLGISDGTFSPVNPYTRETRTLPAPSPAPRSDRIDIDATGISAVTIDPAAAKVDCAAQVHVTGDGPVKVTMLGCQNTRTIDPAPKGH